MGVPDTTLPDLIDKIRSWGYWSRTDHLSSFSAAEFSMATTNLCFGCELKLTELCHKYSCQGCKRLLCGSCVRTSGSLVIIVPSNGSKDVDHVEKFIKACKFCIKPSKRHIGKVYPSESPRASPEPYSPLGSEKVLNYEDAKMVDEDCGPQCCEFRDQSFSPHKLIRARLRSFDGLPSQSSLHHSPIQSDEEAEESGRHYFSTSSEYYHDSSDIDTASVSFRHENYSFRSAGSSPLDSPSRFNINSPRAGLPVQQPGVGSPRPQNSSPPNQGRMAILTRPTANSENADGQSNGMTITVKQDEKFVKPLDFENNHRIWLPPDPEDDENNFFQYEVEDDDDDYNANLSRPSAGGFSAYDRTNSFSKEKQNEEQTEPLKTMVHGHFRALVSQLLQGEGIKFDPDNGNQDWLNIVSNLAWQAASFVKPDTTKGGSMDPGDYVKIKCVASGSPSESTLIKGVVCTKNIKHKRMTSQYKNPRLLLLGGSLEYQRAQNQLASFNTLLEEEMNYIKRIVSNIEAHRPNVLLVEKSVSSYAQEYLLAKEISLVLNVKRPLLERIARCTGALIVPSVDKIPVALIGQCELFRLERVSEVHEAANQYNRKPSKTLMYFEGCPRRLGCTVVLKGSCREELKKIKHVVQYAVFAAYHLSLETSFLADEGAHLPKMALTPSHSVSDNLANAVSSLHGPDTLSQTHEFVDEVGRGGGVVANVVDDVEWEPVPEQLSSHEAQAQALPVDAADENTVPRVCQDGPMCNAARELTSPVPDSFPADCNSTVTSPMQSEVFETVPPVNGQPAETERVDENGVSSDYFAAAESQRSILVSFSSHCVSKGAPCEHSRLLRIRFYGSFDKPLGKYLCDDLFNKASLCRSCKEPMEEHVQCYTHRQGSLTINVRRLGSVRLPGERDGKIWMWHRCLRCAQIDGVPPATRRVIMSDAAWGLSFGKFLELSFSNHATANRVATCGHSLQRDCLRFYGFGSMVAFFHYSPIDILTVNLPPSVLEFNGRSKQAWIKREVEELKRKVENLYAEISDVLHDMERNNASLRDGSLDPSDLHRRILELKDLLHKERDDYHDVLEHAGEESSQVEGALDILDLNQVRRSLLIGSRAWDRRLFSLDSLINSKSFAFNVSEDTGCHTTLKGLMNDPITESKCDIDPAENALDCTDARISEDSCTESCQVSPREAPVDGDTSVSEKSSESTEFPASNLSDKIDSAWTGTDVEPSRTGMYDQAHNLPPKRLMPPARVYSFDSAMKFHEKHHRGSAALHLSAVRSFHASGDYRNMIRDPTPHVVRTYSQISPRDANFAPSFISSASILGEGPRLLLPQPSLSDLVIGVYDDEPTSVISYALSSKEYDDWVSDKLSQHDGSSVVKDIIREDSTASAFLSWQSLGSLDLDYINYGSYGSEEGSLKKSPHFQISFEDDSSCAGGKAKFWVTCYFAKQFDMLLKKCCPSKVDFVCSLSRCRRWSAQGGKSNVYFAKSMDERFIIKQVTKTELESFQEFAPQYFKYLNDALDSGSPTCLAKIFGIFQVTVKGARETKMDLMVMENLFFNRKISRVYDLKGSLRSRYNPDTTGANKVLLDMNLLETLRTNPIFLGSKAKRRLERAVWNDTSFLASVYVMDYSLLVGVDEERKELVLGIIDFMRQYTWDKHLETWVKASGLLGGPKNASPTIISPKQYKRRFRKAMTNYFLTVPDEWSSS